MKPSLTLKIGQQLSMTPQLQQAIRLLQLSTIDLQQEIQEILESNSMLEQQEAGDDFDDSNLLGEEDILVNPSSQEISFKDNKEVAINEPETDAVATDVIPEELPVDTDWDDIYQNNVSNIHGDDEESDFTNYTSVGETLQSHLLWQLNVAHMSDKDKTIAVNIIDCINEDGYLEESLEEIHHGLDDSLDTDFDEVEMVLHCIQQFDPIGIAARDLKECLLLQLKGLFDDHPYYQQAVELVTNHLDLLGSKDYSQIMRTMKIKEDELKQIVMLIQHLNPKPGAQIESKEPEYVIPDIIVRKERDHWIVELNQDAIPKLRVNPQYAGYVQRANTSSDNTFLKNQLQEARWFIKSLQSRNETLMKVATQIVEHQRGFLEYGEEAMKPLILSSVADAVEMHESTISRVTTQKYMYTPRGIYELKYFFSSHVSTSEGGECSSTAIRAMIKKLIAAEDPKKPLSDSKLTTLLEDQGIQVARRTVAKYREALGIGSSSERKRLI
ncbi:RNA polymerase factor sigma-54 [Entomomonas sp. E2T0]|uniref:RNA polymerase factor sigma-54 n=1 Tax=Entomomonas sp. E2T0 TaxID=2930213 RepID=UPI00222824C8|nr:RNA polymerase factor sigma-54 [Entomomonas sp. E2T0]UYZ85139.1 RNA polymerase factor sigma-54 [Entomomonas sp. E2T0]